MSVTDESWAPVARDIRDALRLLGRPIGPRCLPDEDEPCGGTFAQHAVAHLAMIKAICDHQLLRLGPQFNERHEEIYRDILAELARCDQEAGRERG